MNAKSHLKDPDLTIGDFLVEFLRGFYGQQNKTTISTHHPTLTFVWHRSSLSTRMNEFIIQSGKNEAAMTIQTILFTAGE